HPRQAGGDVGAGEVARHALTEVEEMAVDPEEEVAGRRRGRGLDVDLAALGGDVGEALVGRVERGECSRAQSRGRERLLVEAEVLDRRVGAGARLLELGLRRAAA